MFLRFLLPCRYRQAIHVIQQYTCQSSCLYLNKDLDKLQLTSHIHEFIHLQGIRKQKKATKMASYWGRSWGSWSVLWVGVSVGVGMSQNYANAVWLLKYVNVVRSSRTLCTSSASPFSFCTLQHNSRHFSFLICHFSFVAFLSPSHCLLVWCF